MRDLINNKMIFSIYELDSTNQQL